MYEKRLGFFELLKAENYDIFSIEYDYKKNEFKYSMTKEWSDKVQWKGKKTTGVLKRVKTIDEAKITELIKKHNLVKYFDNLLYTIRIGKHEKLEFYYESSIDARCIVGYHSAQRKEYTISGIRRSPFSIEEESVVLDVLSLSKGVAYRCAAGKMPAGGAILCMHSHTPKPDVADSFFSFVAYVIERCQLHAAPESGFSKEDVEKIQKHTSRCVADEAERRDALSSAGMHSLYVCIKAALDFRYGGDSLEGKTIGIEGLGNVAHSLAEKALEEKADIIIGTRNKLKLDEFSKKYEEHPNVSIVGFNEIRMQTGHVYVPCASSGCINNDTIGDINYHIVIGGANHLLRADNYDEEIELAKRMAKKGILFIPDWISNMGSVMYGVSIFMGTEKSLEKQKKDIEKICVPLVKDILAKSQETGLTPLEVAYEMFDSKVYG